MKIDALPDLGKEREVTSLAVLAGEGISVEAHRPESYLAGDSLWENNAPTELAQPDAFARDPERVWRWYLWRRGVIAEAGPSVGQRAVARLADRFERLAVVTESVDGQQQRAVGADGPSVVELYGNLWCSRCACCGRRHEDRRVRIERLPPTCDHCGGLMRPDVIWYGESMKSEVIERAERVVAACQALLVVGTAAGTTNAVGLTATARQSGAEVFELDLEGLLRLAGG